MARSTRKPRKGSPSKTRHGKEKKSLRKRIGSERKTKRQDRFDPFAMLMEIVDEVKAEQVYTCNRCEYQRWPASSNCCPRCKWDGHDLVFTLIMPQPEIYS